MTTNPPRVKAGGLPPTQLHRVDASQLTDNRAVMVAGDPEPSRSTPPTATEFAGPEPIDWQSFRFLVIGGAVIAITLLLGWRFV